MINNLKTHSLLAIEKKVNIEEVSVSYRSQWGFFILGRPTLRYFHPATPETGRVRLTPSTHDNFYLVSSFK